MISEHFAALKARIEAGQGLAGKVHDTVRLDVDGGLVRDMYVILYRSTPEIESDRLSAVATASSKLTFTIDVRAVGTSPAAVATVADRIITQLVGYRLNVAGRSCSPITVDDTGRVLVDQSVKGFMYYADLAFELVSEPA